jgi:hypothetical protein
MIGFGMTRSLDDAIAAALVLRHMLSRTNRSVLVITGAATPPRSTQSFVPPSKGGGRHEVSRRV